MDIGYYQSQGSNNFLRPICNHVLNGVEQNHCVATPNILDVNRTALMLGALFTSSRTRVIGVDGKAGVVIQDAMNTLCARAWLPQSACTASESKLAYEVTNENHGWYYFHHHHFHISLKPVTSAGSQLRSLSLPGHSAARSLMPSTDGIDTSPALEILGRSQVPGEAFISD
jgi:hypothetical protein